MADEKQATRGDIMPDDPNLDPVEDALNRSPWCLLVPTGYPDDPDIIGPFTSYEETEIWALTYRGAEIRKMVSVEVEVLLRRECEEIEAWKGPRN
jgi:hypothetical protein